MHFEKRLVVGLVSLSFAAGLSIDPMQPATGQELRELLMERMEAQQQMNPGQQGLGQQQQQMIPGQQGLGQQPQQGLPQQTFRPNPSQLQGFAQGFGQQPKPQAIPQQPIDKSVVSELTLHVKNVDGQQMVITPKGVPMPLPGAGVRGDDVRVFISASGGYWYKDRNDQTVDLTSCVKMMQGNAAQPGGVTQIYNTQTTNSGGTAAVAGMSAMAGAAIGAAATDGWGVPYVEPVRYGAAGAAYYDRYGADAARYGAYRGQQYAHEGEAAGVGAAHYGAVQGQESAERGAAAGASAAHYGANQGQQSAERGAAAGASAAHYGANQGQQSAERGAAAGRAASQDGGFGHGGFGGAGGFGGGRFGGGGFGGGRRR